MSDRVDLAIVLDCADRETLARLWADALRSTILGGVA